MPRCLAILALTLCLIGCSRFNSRSQGPFGKTPSSKGYAQNPAPAPNNSPLVMNGPNQPQTPTGSTDSGIPLPPRPPEPNGFASGVPVPQPPLPPIVTDPNLTPASGLELPPRPTPTNPTPPKPAPKPEPTGPSPAAINLAQLKRVAGTAATSWKNIATYEVQLTRREVVGEYKSPTEEVLFHFRKEPMSVYMRNTGDAGKGREVVYFPSKHGDKMHIATGVGDGAPIVGWKTSMSPDSPKVREKSRQSIRDAGFGTTIDKFTTQVGRIESGKLRPDAIRYVGLVRRPETGDLPLEAVERVYAAGEEDLPNGGNRQWFFDGKAESPSFGLPILVILTENLPNGGVRELEYYSFTRFRAGVSLTDADFDPARLKKK